MIKLPCVLNINSYRSGLFLFCKQYSYTQGMVYVKACMSFTLKNALERECLTRTCHERAKFSSPPTYCLGSSCSSINVLKKRAIACNENPIMYTCICI